MMKGETLLILGHGVIGQGQLCPPARGCHALRLFNDTSRYLDNIFTIDNPEFEKHIPDIYPAELQLNKANTKYFRQRNFFLRFKYKLLVVTFIPAFTTNAMTLDFLSLISHG